MRSCPRCKSAVITWFEIWAGHGIIFEQSGNGIDPVGLLFEGSPVKVVGQCACGHSWTVKRVRQISDLPGHPDFQGREKA
jgi:hypothetical protein